MNKERINELLLSAKNPKTNKTFKEESRSIVLEENSGELIITYKRDGISAEDKKIIEKSLLKELEQYYSSEKIVFKTISENSSDILGASPSKKTEQSAQLKVGHGPSAASKKKVIGAKKVIAVSSCKGGVGKSTVTVNLAYALKNLGKKVGILDADIYGPSIPMLLNKRNSKPSANENKKILPVEANGISFISFGLFINESDPVIWRGPMLGGVLNQFLFDVDWGELDYLILDLPPGTGDMQLSMVQATDIDGAIVVSTPQEVALLDSKKGLNMFNQVKVPVLGMVENMSYFTPEDDLSKKYYLFGEGGVRKAAKELDLNVLAEIPLEIALREGSDNGTPYMDEKKYEGRPVWNSYMSLAKNIETSFYDESDNSSKKGFFKRLFS